MNTRLLVLGTLAGALTLFAWESVSNTAIPWHSATMRSFRDSSAVVQAIKTNISANGMYVDARGVVAAVSLTPELKDKSGLLGLMLTRQFALDMVASFLVLLAMLRMPRATTSQYVIMTAALSLAVSASVLVSDWNWYGFGAAWTLVNTIDRTIGYVLMALVLAIAINRWSGRVRTDEWGGVRAPTGPPSTMAAPTPGVRG